MEITTRISVNEKIRLRKNKPQQLFKKFVSYLYLTIINYNLIVKCNETLFSLYRYSKTLN